MRARSRIDGGVLGVACCSCSSTCPGPRIRGPGPLAKDMLSYLACCVVACTGLAGVGRRQEAGTGEMQAKYCAVLYCTVQQCRHTWQRNDDYDNYGKGDRYKF